jgi:hypothetical protein
MLRQWLLSRILTLPNDMPATTLEADRPLKPMTGLLDPRRAEAGTSAGRGPANADASGKHAAAVANATAAPETYPTIRKFLARSQAPFDCTYGISSEAGSVTSIES